MKNKFLPSLIALTALSVAQAQILIDTTTPYTQNFDSLPTSSTAHVPANDPAAPAWVDNVTLAGWYGTAIDDSMYVSNGSSGGLGGLTGVASLGTTSATERALGMIRNNSSGFFGVRFENDSSGPITELTIAYTGEQWRRASNAGTYTMQFAYAIGVDSLTDAGFANVTQLNFVAPQSGGGNAALDGNLAVNQVAISHTITGLNIASGEEFWLRWTDSGNNNTVLAIDNLTVTAIPEPGTLVLLGIALGALVLFRRRK